MLDRASTTACEEHWQILQHVKKFSRGAYAVRQLKLAIGSVRRPEAQQHSPAQSAQASKHHA